MIPCNNLNIYLTISMVIDMKIENEADNNCGTYNM